MWSILVLTTLFTGYAYGISCRTPLGNISECIPLYECPTLLKAFEQRPLESNVISFLRQSQCGFEGYVPRVCCGPLQVEQTVYTTQRPRPITTSSNFDGQTDPVSSEDSETAPNGQCGKDTNGDRIYGGQITELDEFPWMALLGYRTRSGTVTFQCGGVLINHRYILTAAHCVTGAVEREVGTLIRVRLGEYNTQTETDCLDGTCADPPQEIPVQGAYPHSGYIDGNKSRRNDIGLVRLAKRAKYTYYVQPICLVSSSARLTSGDTAYVAGWGKTLNGKNSPIKLKLSVPIFNKDECYTKYRSLGADLGEYQLCAGGVFSEDACRGDSGGPLMKRRTEGVWEVVGIVSFGYGCGRDGWPGVYTSVAGYIDWIGNTLRETNV